MTYEQTGVLETLETREQEFCLFLGNAQSRAKARYDMQDFNEQINGKYLIRLDIYGANHFLQMQSQPANVIRGSSRISVNERNDSIIQQFFHQETGKIEGSRALSLQNPHLQLNRKRRSLKRKNMPKSRQQKQSSQEGNASYSYCCIPSVSLVNALGDQSILSNNLRSKVVFLSFAFRVDFTVGQSLLHTTPLLSPLHHGALLRRVEER